MNPTEVMERFQPADRQDAATAGGGMEGGFSVAFFF